MFEQCQLSRRLLDEVADDVLVAEKVGTLDGVVAVHLETVVFTRDRRGTALRRNGVAAHRIDLRDERNGGVGIDLARGDCGAQARGVKPPAFYAARAVTDLCTSSLINYGFYADQPVFAAQIGDGDRQAELPYRWMHGSEMDQSNPLFGLVGWPFALRDRFVVLPADKWQGWSQDARIELEAMTP